MEKVSGTLSNTPSVSNYESLGDKPQINGITLSGNKTNEELGLVSKTQFEELQRTIEELVDGNEVAY